MLLWLVGWNPGDNYVFVIVGKVRKNMLNIWNGITFCFTIYVFHYFDYAHGVCKNNGRLSIVVLLKSFENCTSFSGFWKMKFFTHVSTDDEKSNCLVSFRCVGVYFSMVSSDILFSFLSTNSISTPFDFRDLRSTNGRMHFVTRHED